MAKAKHIQKKSPSSKTSTKAKKHARSTKSLSMPHAERGTSPKKARAGKKQRILWAVDPLKKPWLRRCRIYVRKQ